MTGRPATDLLAGAAHDLATATLAISRCQLGTTASARRAVAAYREAAGALHTMTARLLWARPVGGRGATHRGGTSTVLVALRLEHALQALAWPPSLAISPSPSVAAEPAVTRRWRSAATSLRAAAYLISPVRASSDAATGHRSSALVDLGWLATTLAVAARPLAARAVQAGLDRTTLQQLDAAGAELAQAARAVCARDGTADEPLWRQIELVHARIRQGDPLVELADRAARLHRYAVSLTSEQRAAAGTLALLALVGQTLHATTAVLVGRRNAAGTAPGQLAWQLQRIAERGTGWQTVHRQLRALRSERPASPAVRDEAARVTTLLRALEEAPAEDALPTLLHCCRAFVETARGNEAVLDRLARAGQLSLAGSAGSRQGAVDDPVLLARVDAVRQGYHLARGGPRHDLAAGVTPRACTPRHRTPVAGGSPSAGPTG